MNKLPQEAKPLHSRNVLDILGESAIPKNSRDIIRLMCQIKVRIVQESSPTVREDLVSSLVD